MHVRFMIVNACNRDGNPTKWHVFINTWFMKMVYLSFSNILIWKATADKAVYFKNKIIMLFFILILFCFNLKSSISSPSCRRCVACTEYNQKHFKTKSNQVEYIPDKEQNTIAHSH